jgi:hypothetical protein
MILIVLGNAIVFNFVPALESQDNIAVELEAVCRGDAWPAS